MYNLLIANGLALAVFLLSWAIVNPIAGVIPALLTLAISWFLLSRPCPPA